MKQPRKDAQTSRRLLHQEENIKAIKKQIDESSMTMMSRNSSDSSLDDEQESTVSSKSGPRKSLGSFISQSSRRTRADKDSTSDDCSDMPSLSSFRLEDMSASVASRGSSYASRGECDISLPSLSSFRMDEMSLASSYHSGTNHMSEESAEGWSSFTSGNASADTDSDDEFANASSSDPPRRPSSPSESCGDGGGDDGGGGGAESGGDDGDDGGGGGGGRESSNVRSSRTAAKSGILKSDAPVDTIHGAAANKDCNLTSNARPPRRRSPETEDMKSSLPMRRPRRTLSPTTPNQRSRADDDDEDFELEQKVPASPTEDQISRPSRALSPDRTPVERTESLPLSVLHSPTRTAQGDSSSSVRLSGDSSSTLRGGDSLPRLPRRTSTMDDRSTHAEEDGDDDTKLSMEGSRVSDDVTEISDGSIDSDLSDDDSSITRNSSSMPLHEINKLTDKEATNSQEGQLIDGINSIKIHSVVVRDVENGTIPPAEETIGQQDRPVSQPLLQPLDPRKEENSPKGRDNIGESATNKFVERVTTPQNETKVHTEESIDQSTNEVPPHRQKLVEDQKVPIRGSETAVIHESGIPTNHPSDNPDEDKNRTSVRANETDPGSTSNNTTDQIEESTKPAGESTNSTIDSVSEEATDTISQSKNEEVNDRSEKVDDQSNEENGTEAAATNAGNETDGKGPVRNRKSPTSVRELEGSLAPKPAAAQKATDDDVVENNNEKATPDESGATSAEESGTTSSETEVEDSSEDAKNGGGKKKEVSKRGLLRKMSNSFKQIGKSTSFRNSFRMIGRTASKIKQIGKREDGS